MNIAGTVIFDPTSSANPANSANTPIPNVPVVLQEQGDASVTGATTLTGVAALTDANGTFTFTDVPAGSYRVIEAWGYAGAAAGAVSYSGAATITATPADPAASAVSNPPATTNRINSLSPNTIFVTVTDADVTGLYFLDAPTHEEPLDLNNYVTIGNNLFSGGDNGTIGVLPNGTPVQTSPAGPPYPIDTAFQYQQYGGMYIPYDGYYSVSNTIVNSNFSGAWFNLSDHTSGDETGRMLIINGDLPGEPFFSESATVQPNTNYVFSTWILNVDSRPGEIPPELRVTVTGNTSTTPIFDQNLTGDLTTTNIPTWRQIGNVINSGSNTTLTLTFISAGQSGYGNDFIIDDISLYQLQAAPVTELTKSASTTYARPGDVINYTVTFINDGPSAVFDAIFTDPTPEFATIVPGSLLVNGVMYDTALLETGLNLGDLGVGDSVTITFSARANADVSTGDQIINTAQIVYEFEDELGETREITTSSESIVTVVISPDCPTCPTGATGPTGPAGTGATGPTGPTGPAGEGASVTDEDAHIVSMYAENTPPWGFLPLESSIVIHGSNITHNPAASQITLAAGTYLVNYSVTAQYCGCGRYKSMVTLHLYLNNAIYPGSSASATCTRGDLVNLSGTAIIDAAQASNSLQLLNGCEDVVTYLNTSMTIVRIL